MACFNGPWLETIYWQVKLPPQVLVVAVQSTHALPLTPQLASRSRISTTQRPSLVQQPEQLAAPQGPQVRLDELHRSLPLHFEQVVPATPHASAVVPG